MKLNLFPILFLCFILSSEVLFSQTYADKSYYLIDSLNLEELTSSDKQLIDSSLALYHNAKHDTNQINALGIITEKMIHNDWKKYNMFIKHLIERKLKTSSNPILKKFYLSKVAIANTNIGVAYYEQDNLPKALEYYHKSLKINKTLNNQIEIASILGSIANAYLDQGYYTKALEYSFEGLKISEKIGDKKRIILSHMNIGHIYSAIEEFSNAIESYNKSLKISQDIENKLYEGYSYNYIGTAYAKKKKYDKAIENFKNSVSILEGIGRIRGLNDVFISISSIYQIQEKPSMAILYLEKALTLSKSINSELSISKVELNMAIMYFNKGEVKTAKKYALQSFQLAKKIGFIDRIKASAELLARIYKEEKNYKKGLEMYELYTELKDSILNENNAKKLFQQESKYQIEKKEQEIKLLDEQNKIQQLKLKQKNWLIWSLTGGIVLISIIIVLIISVQKTKASKKDLEFSKKQAELKQRALRAQMNPHFLFNSLNSIQRIYVEGNISLANDYMADFSSLLRSVLNNSDKESITVKEDVQMLELYLAMEKMRTDGQINYKIAIDADIDTKDIKISPLLIQPFVENAIWHGILPKKEKGNIKISLNRIDEDVLQCQVEDDGVGIFTSKKNKAQTHESKGMTLAKERIGIANAVKEEELSTGGTRITIKIPIQ